MYSETNGVQTDRQTDRTTYGVDCRGALALLLKRTLHSLDVYCHYVRVVSAIDYNFIDLNGVDIDLFLILRFFHILFEYISLASNIIYCCNI